jgi:predicted HTH domain antitoxin
MEMTTTRIPKDLSEEIERIKEEEKVGTVELMRELLTDAIERYKLKKALEMLREHKVSYRKAAKIAGLPYYEFYDRASKSGIEIGYIIKDLEEDLKLKHHFEKK